MKSNANFIVIDTEGQPILRELAIVDDQGELIYEAFTENHPRNPKIRHKTKPLPIIVDEFLNLAHSKTIVCHYAQHDIEVLRNTFRAVGVPAPPLNFQCSFELAQRYLPELNSHSLEALSQHLRLKLDQSSFQKDAAHRAKYDALFTYQLYKHLMLELLKTELKQQPNPFGSSRVDTPFQDHPDYREIFADEFERIKSIIGDIKLDPNHQTKGTVVIGEPGAGKTHLMMRLAKDLLTTNRLLFIRQPNNPESVIFHTYSRILESLIQTIPGSPHTQLEYLLANSFAGIIKEFEGLGLSKTQKDEKILQIIQEDSLKLFTDLAQEETKTKRDYWQHIEKRASDWWNRNFSSAGYAPKILQGLVRFCGYTDFNRRQIITQWLAMNDLPQEELERVGLSSWGEEMSREEVSLEALKVLGRLSLLDEPLIFVFDQLEGLGLKHNERLLQTFGEAIKEIFTHVPNSLMILNLFPDRWEQFKQVFDGSIIDRVSQSQIFLSRPSNQQLKQLLNLKAKSVNISIDEIFVGDEIEAILNYPSIRSVVNAAADYYRLKIDGIPLPRQYNFSSTPLEESEVNQRLHQLEGDLAQIKQVLYKVALALNLTQTDESVEVSELLDQLEQVKVSPVRRQLQDYFKQERARLERDWNKPRIITDTDDLGKLTTVLEALMVAISPLDFDVLKLGRRVVPEHLVVQTINQNLVICFLHLNGSPFYHRIKNLNQLVGNYPNFKFYLCRDEIDYPVNGQRSLDELARFQGAKNAELIVFDRETRIIFELIYQMIVDIQNYDLDVKLEEALDVVLTDYSKYWLFENLLNLN